MALHVRLIDDRDTWVHNRVRAVAFFDPPHGGPGMRLDRQALLDDEQRITGWAGHITELTTQVERGYDPPLVDPYCLDVDTESARALYLALKEKFDPPGKAPADQLLADTLSREADRVDKLMDHMLTVNRANLLPGANTEVRSVHITTRVDNTSQIAKKVADQLNKRERRDAEPRPADG